MDAIEQLKEDVREGRIDADRLVDLIVTLQRQLQAAKQRIAELEKQLGWLDHQPRSMSRFRCGPKRNGRKHAARKNARPNARADAVGSPPPTRSRRRNAPKTSFPKAWPKSDCQLSHTRPVWRLENGRAVLIAYQIYRGPNNQYGKIPGVLGRSEFGLEIVVEIAYLVYVVGLSFDKVCLLLNFFQNLQLGKSQADALLHQLSRHWQNEFDVLCTLLANSLVVHADETSWSINSVWAFLSEKARRAVLRRAQGCRHARSRFSIRRRSPAW